MDRYVVAGNPVEHSQSPFIHALFARATGEHVSYGRLLCPMDAFGDTVRHFAAEGGRGCNVTVPFKFEAFRLAARHSERARLAEAVNTLRFDADGWWGDNTDGAGLVRDIEHNAQRPLAGRRVLLIGAGGAAAGALGPLIQARPAVLAVANRTIERAQVLLERHRPLAASQGVHLLALELDDAGAAYDVVVNASASSMHGGDVPVDARVLRPGALALDMMYGPAAQRFVQWAEQHGAIGRDGLGMLVEQAAEAFSQWRGMRPDTAPVLSAVQLKLHEAAS
ncbi:shikimate dehydrogenase [Piscinibacter sp. XHJ-5]|uniref:shikimate dehydrogenase n=1 Tax=Piscinibacter sp. XHJ-5 TaxID=3037797 RepID=UPI0024530F9C|nr:shikimate dehydrogenase [Piscinibacter sp. XHJ-5]